MVDSAVQYRKYYDLGLDLPEIRYELRKTAQTLRSRQTKLKSWTNEWMVRRIADQELSIAIRDLKTFIRKDREGEITENMIRELNELKEEDTLWCIKNLREKPCQVRGTGKNQMDIQGTVTTTNTSEKFTMKALIDSGCTSSCINEEFVAKHKMNLTALPKPIPVYNADGLLNVSGSLTHVVQVKMNVEGHEELIDLGVSNLGKSDIFLGHNWLKHHNPTIDWFGKTLKFNRCPGMCYQRKIGEGPKSEEEEEWESGDRLLAVHVSEEEWGLRAKTTHSTEIASAKKDDRTLEEILPKYCLAYKDVFDKKTFDELPPQRPWDHAIELLPDAKPLNCKIYLLSKEEQTQLEEFLKENLDTNRIQPSKSLMASPFFFVKKKDGKLRPVQDYRKLNEMKIKN